MRTHTTTALAALAATVMLALALVSASATARNLSITEKEFEILYRSLTFEAAGVNISCPITLLGHFFERTVPKVANSQVGVYTHAEPLNSAEPPCTGGTMTILNETLPWRFNYIGFTGRLPSIERIRYSLIGVAFKIRDHGGLNCLAGTTAREPSFAEQQIGSNGRVESLRSDETVAIRLGGGFLCEIAGNSHFLGTGTILNLARTSAITVTLI